MLLDEEKYTWDIFCIGLEPIQLLHVAIVFVQGKGYR